MSQVAKQYDTNHAHCRSNHIDNYYICSCQPDSK